MLQRKCCIRLCPLRAGGHQWGCLPVLARMAVGATTPFFTTMFAYFVTLKTEAWVTYAALVPVVAGVMIATGGEPSFHLYGFIMCITATAARAFKFVLQGILLFSEGEKLKSANLLLYMAPGAVLGLLPATIINGACPSRCQAQKYDSCKFIRHRGPEKKDPKEPVTTYMETYC